MSDYFSIRKATEADTPVIFSLINQLAEYEKLSDAVITSEEELRENIFHKGHAEVLIAEDHNVPVGFALYFYNFSTFVGRAGLYLEDLFVEPVHRGKGYGKKLLIALAKIAQEKKCGRMEWSVLNWNQPSIDFYKSLDAIPMDEWTVYRLTQDKIEVLANS
ncbi:GNAT family acetyltransferase [Elizabethkingia meningoseptica]|uniref:GNAT family N-acetyltransferase n=1 Tax=Elizabethkingia meningoseptica TaxID=238 RepID=UPI000332BEFB|nr:GNAT family N-acetyltransferase [Elizabethkingia meningoseptica]AQX05762.1 GNAT family acetyltransferase [Elizabethkingia meningoseptica]AQX47805.1 GNAT family acetyltransferase [Elizabethkingia meningoseptica]EOR28492.1 acetyltransferase, GNAT family protein [Elizabethkingia meningoseptica ATCC 13253 = NBRC 12535]KUY23931.1 GNAT family acetyltransferase [Elizabethkingia meningoseptica]OPB67871.1 GNAT family acetyltransferase [Elizabethkingia meningoseptica]